VPAVVNVVRKSGYVPDDRTPAQVAEFFRAQVDEAQKAVQAAGIEPN